MCYKGINSVFKRMKRYELIFPAVYYDKVAEIEIMALMQMKIDLLKFIPNYRVWFTRSTTPNGYPR